MDDDFLAPPAFVPEAALTLLKRQLRELRALRERGDGFDYKAQPVLRLAADGNCLRAELAKRPARSPEWQRFELRSSPDVRRFSDELRARLARWERDD
jgi:hypothetical protein